MFKSKLKKEKENAEYRALTHFMKLQKIEEILTIEKAKKTPSVFIVDEIEKIIKGERNVYKQ